jgi:transposase InsO family protein
VPVDVRDAVLDYVEYWRSRTELTQSFFLKRLELPRVKYRDWVRRYGKKEQHNGLIPKHHWLLPEERRLIIDYKRNNPEIGYRALTYHLIDNDIVAVSPASISRTLREAGLLSSWCRSSSKGKGYTQPLEPHEQWHTDVSYINICGTFYYFSAVLDGCSRAILHWQLSTSMKEEDAELLLLEAKERYPKTHPRLITDNGPCYVAHDFKKFVKTIGVSHTLISPYYPQSNGKIERFNKTLKVECIRKTTPLTPDDARRLIDDFVYCYNHERLHAALEYVTPIDRLKGRHTKIFETRKIKIEQARKARAQAHQLQNSYQHQVA